MTSYNASTLGYDTDGQLTSIPGDTYTWDTRRHLSAVSGQDSASFVYDALGRRIKKTVNGTTTQFVYDGLNPVQELDGTGTITARMHTGLNVDEYFQRNEPSCCALAYLTDALGSTVAMTDGNGVIQVQHTYEPFGKGGVYIANVNSTNSYEFTGRETDGFKYGMHYYRGRYYSAVLQRFVSQDPMDFAGGDTNLYAYVANGPTNDVDPSGQCPEGDPCPPEKRRFFNWLDAPLGMMASNLETSKALLFALAAKEGGWTTEALNHNIRLNNPFGVNSINHRQAAGNIQYQSLQQAISDWQALFGDRIYGDTVPGTFADDLQHPGVGRPYNSQNPNYVPQFLQVYESVLRFMRLCNIQ